MRVCEEHPGNHQCGGCARCTFFEYERYRDLYHGLQDAVRDNQRARVMLSQSNRELDRMAFNDDLVVELS